MKRFRIFLGSILISSLLILQPSYAEDSGSSGSAITNYLLTLILGTTAGILQLLNQTPAYAEALTEMAKSWIETNDPANTIGNNQYIFSSLGNLRTTGEQNQLSATVSLTNQFLLAGSRNSDNPILPSNANDLTYTILFGDPIVKSTSTSTDYSQNIQNYIKNVTGSTLLLDQPNPNWPDGKSKTQYTNLYNTLAAIQSYDQYLVSGLSNLKDSEDLSTQLTAQATNPDWFKQIATEALGLVLRHILMYTSQSFVQINQIIELQQKQLAVQAMTNSLLLVLVQSNVGSQLQQSAGRSGSTGGASPVDKL
jgi:hypothetical protein